MRQKRDYESCSQLCKEDTSGRSNGNTVGGSDLFSNEVLRVAFPHYGLANISDRVFLSTPTQSSASTSDRNTLTDSVDPSAATP